MEKYFVTQKKHNSTTNTWENGVLTKDSLNSAQHQFHAFLSTYAYGQDENIDYCAVDITDAGNNRIKWEVDNRLTTENEG